MTLILNFFVMIYYCYLTRSMSILPRGRAIITGSTGTLGKHLVDGCLSKRFQVIAGYRDKLKMDKLIHHTNHSIIPYRIDLRKLDDDILPLVGAVSRMTNDYHTLLLNNAGVCLEGSTFNSLRESLVVNAVSPITLSERIIQSCSSKVRISIINISSGDGELSYLNSELQAIIDKICTMEDWKRVVSKYLEADNFYPSTEYAYGETPMYSVSKAFFNRASRLLNKESPDNCRVLTVCPGNFQSQMTSTEDTDDIMSAADAANGVIEMALNWTKFDGDSFLRRGQSIPW